MQWVLVTSQCELFYDPLTLFCSFSSWTSKGMPWKYWGTDSIL